MSSKHKEQAIEKEFRADSCRKIVDYAEANGSKAMRDRLIQLVEEGLMEGMDVEIFCSQKPNELAETRFNFGLGELDDHRDLMVRDIQSNPDIIAGVLKSDTTGMFVGASKSYKTWHLIRLALCIAHGIDWFGCKTKKSKV